MNVNDPIRDVHAICALLHQARSHQTRLLACADLTHGGATRAEDLGRALDCAQSQADWIKADLISKQPFYRDRKHKPEAPK